MNKILDTASLERPAFKVKDLSLAEFGRKEIRLAEQEMPGLMELKARYLDEKPLAGKKVMGSLHMTIQTAVLIETLVALGCNCGVDACCWNGVVGAKIGEKVIHSIPERVS